MRLIDADALTRKWQAVLDEKADEKGTVAYLTFELFIDRLKEEPTIETEPRRGRWESIDDNSWRCSVCRRENCYAYDELSKRFTDYYCPNCGAKMDGDNNV